MVKGQYFDLVGETEPGNTVYTLTVLCPARLPPKWLPEFVTRKPVTHPNTGATYTIKPDNTNPNLNCFEAKHLDEMAAKVIKIKSAYFPVDFRCKHVRASQTCDYGCYVLEKGGSNSRSKCKRSDCEGHVYMSRVEQDQQGQSCFGKKGERMVCIAQ